MSKDDFSIGATSPQARVALEEKLGHVFARPELLDLALFGVVQQPEARGGPERTEAEEKNL